MRVHSITSKTSGKIYEILKTRTASSSYLPTWHYRRAGDEHWQSLGADTMKQARELLNA